MLTLTRKWILVASACLAISLNVNAQQILTMEKAIDISAENSPDLKKSLMNLQRYQELLVGQLASLKSSFGLTLNPVDYSQSRSFDTRLSEWYTNERIGTSGTFSISQPIIWTNATISLQNKFGWQQNSSTSNDITNKTFTNDLSLSINQPLFSYNSQKMELKTMRMDFENAFISYALQRLNMEKSISTQFYNLYMAQQNLVISRSEFEDAKANYEVIKNKVEADMSARSELFQAELNLANSQSTVDNRIVSLANAEDDFKRVMGLSLEEEIVVEAELSINPVQVDLERAIINAKSTRLELRQREITREKAEFDLIKVKDNNKFKGSIGASIGITGNDEDFTRIYDQPTRSPRIAVSFNVPIFDWGTRKARIRAQEIQIEMNEIDAQEEIKQIEIDIRKTCRSLNNLLGQIDIAKKSVENAQLTYDLNAEKYRNGDLTGMEMSQFQSQLSSKKINYAQSLINYRLELLNLKIVSLFDFEKNEPLIPMETYKPNIEEKVKLNKK